MARPCRLQAENCFYHITCRGDDRKKIFINETDYQKFLEYLRTAKEKFKFHLYAYCLLNNHYHLLLKITQVNLSRIMQYINTSYTIYYNIKRKHCGHLFQGRFKSILVEADSYFSELTRYIHLNPVKAKIVDSPEKYRWSSYNAYITAKNDDIVDKTPLKELLEMDEIAYSNFVHEGTKTFPNPFKNVYAGFILGKAKFIKDKLNQLQKEIDSKDFAHKRAIKNRVSPQQIINLVAEYFKLNPEQMCKNKKRPMAAKKIALYLLRHKTGLTNTEIGSFFDMKSAAVSKSALDIKRNIKNDKTLNKTISQITSKIEV